MVPVSLSLVFCVAFCTQCALVRALQNLNEALLDADASISLLPRRPLLRREQEPNEDGQSMRVEVDAKGLPSSSGDLSGYLTLPATSEPPFRTRVPIADRPVRTPTDGAQVGAEAVSEAESQAAGLLQKETLMQNSIPSQLILTGPFASLDELPPQTKQNLDNTLAHALGMKTRYLNDDACRDFLKEHFDNELVELYDGETHGSFRGDMCRSAVLLQEGGFYADLDFQFFMPVHKLIDEHTTFMTAYTAQGSWSKNVSAAVVELGDGGQVSIQPILNALIAVRPKSPIMERTMKNIKDWYAGSRQGLLGPMAMAKALAEIVREDCPQVPLKGPEAKAQWKCGPESLRFYQEEYFGGDCPGEGQIVCPQGRARSSFFGSHFGVFSMGTQKREARLVGWSRYLGCDDYGCGINGGVASL